MPALLALLLFLAGCGYRSVDLPLPLKPKACKKVVIQNKMPKPWLLGHIYQKQKIAAQIRLGQDIASYLAALLPCEPMLITIQDFQMRYLPERKGINLWARLSLKVQIKRPNHLWIKDIVVVRKERVEGEYEKALAKIAHEMIQEAAKEIKRVLGE